MVLGGRLPTGEFMIAAQADMLPAFRAGMWLAVVLVAVGLGALAVRRMRRRLLNPSDVAELGLTLDDLRRQRDQGMITTAEYDAIRRQIVAKMTAASRSTATRTADKVVQARRVS